MWLVRGPRKNVPWKMLSTAEIGWVKSMKIIPREKIWIPEPEKYSMIACIGRDLAGLKSWRYVSANWQWKMEGMTLTIRPDPMPSSFLVRWIFELALRVPRHLLGHAIWWILQLSLHHPWYIESITLDEAEADCLVVKGARYPGGLGMEGDLDDSDEASFRGRRGAKICALMTLTWIGRRCSLAW